eukprot:g42676.t1
MRPSGIGSGCIGKVGLKRSDGSGGVRFGPVWYPVASVVSELARSHSGFCIFCLTEEVRRDFDDVRHLSVAVSHSWVEQLPYQAVLHPDSMLLMVHLEKLVRDLVDMPNFLSHLRKK